MAKFSRQYDQFGPFVSKRWLQPVKHSDGFTLEQIKKRLQAQRGWEDQSDQVGGLWSFILLPCEVPQLVIFVGITPEFFKSWMGTFRESRCFKPFIVSEFLDVFGNVLRTWVNSCSFCVGIP